MFTTIPKQITNTTVKDRCFQLVEQAINDDRVQGMMFGSMAYKLASGLESFYTHDVDILFYSTTHMGKFAEVIAELAQSNGLKYQTHSGFDYGYSYTEALSTGTQNILHATLGAANAAGSFHWEADGSFNWDGYITIHGTVLNLADGFSEEELDVLAKRDISTAELLADKLAFQDFLANVYIDKKVFHKLKNLTTVQVRQDSKFGKMKNIIAKYSSRGVIVNMIAECTKSVAQTQLRPSVEVMTAAKDSYRSKGLVVIPTCQRDLDRAGKCPAVPNWHNLTNEYDFTCQSGQNIGIVCGPNSGIVCIDVDVKDRGVEMFSKMARHYGLLPVNTAIQRSGNGGYHYLFKYNHDRMSNMQLKIKCPKLNGNKIGVDMWIQGCQFVAYPSVNFATNTQYQWDKPLTSVEALPDLPEWIYDLYTYENITEQGVIMIPTANDSTRDRYFATANDGPKYSMKIDTQFKFVSNIPSMIGSLTVSELWTMIRLFPSVTGSLTVIEFIFVLSTPVILLLCTSVCMIILKILRILLTGFILLLLALRIAHMVLKST